MILSSTKRSKKKRSFPLSSYQSTLRYHNRKKVQFTKILEEGESLAKKKRRR